MEEFRVGGGGSLGWSLDDVYTSSAFSQITLKKSSDLDFTNSEDTAVLGGKLDLTYL